MARLYLISIFMVGLAENVVNGVGYVANSSTDSVDAANSFVRLHVDLVAQGSIHVKVPKCCEMGSILNKTCVKANVPPSIDVPVHDHNETFLNTLALSSNQYQLDLYHHPLVCSRISLEPEDNPKLLVNGSLIVGGEFPNMFSPDEFCVETLAQDGKYIGRVLICMMNNSVEVGYYVLVVFVILSLIFITATDVLFIFMKSDVPGVHKGCMIAYCTAMTLTLFTLTFVLFGSDTSRTVCVLLGVFFQIFYLTSQCLLAILCCDMAFILYYYPFNDKSYHQRKYAYVVIAVLLPLISLFSLCQGGNPAVPNAFFKSEFNVHLCSFNDEERSKVFFYVPLGTSFLIGVTSLITAIRLWYQKDKKKHIPPESRASCKDMLKQSTMCTAVNVLCLVAHLMSYAIDVHSGIAVAGNFIEVLQGVLLFIIFIVYKRKHVSKAVRKQLSKRQKTPTLNANGQLEAQPLNPLVGFGSVGNVPQQRR